jgi:serine/threonine protein kinase
MIDIGNYMDWTGRMLSRYRLIQLLGRGGMGEVWLAEDTELRRQVAAKLLPIVPSSEQAYLEDFAREARTAAALDHPHILPVHDFGDQPVSQNEIITYLIMPYIQGGTLSERVRQRGGPLPVEEALRWLRQAAEAIDYAHSRQVIHRDIKPGNMLLQGDWLFLTDFGIARLSSSSIRARTHSGAGTPEYMAPEQIQGRAEPASDRYSLACTAYLLLTGVLPFQGATPYETLMKHMTGAPLPPRQINAALPPGIEQALLWGLAREPQARPPDCSSFVKAIEQGWSRGAPTTNPADPEATLLAPWSRYQVANQETVRASGSITPPSASGQPAPAGPAPAFAPGQAAPFSPSARAGSLQGTPPPTGYDGYGSMPSGAPAVSTAYTHYPPQPSQPAVLPPSAPPPEQPKVGRRGLLIGGGVAAAALIAGGGGLYYVLSQNKKTAQPARIPPGPQKLIKGVPLLKLSKHTASVWNAVWSPSGRYLATAGEDTHVLVWDIASLLSKPPATMQTVATPLRDWKTSDNIYANCLSWSADSRFLLVNILTASKALVFDLRQATNEPLLTYHNPTTDMFATDYDVVAWSPDSSIFAAARSYDTHGLQQVDLWQINRTGAPLMTLTAPVPAFAVNNSFAGISNLTWSADSSEVIALTSYDQVIVWNAHSGKTIQIFDLPNRPTQNNFLLRAGIAASPLSSRLMAATDEDLGTVWDTPNKKLLLALKTTDEVPYMTSIYWAPNGKYIAGSYARSPQVYIWDAQHTSNDPLKQPLTPLHAFGVGLHTKALLDVEWSPNGRYIASAAADTSVIVWKVDGA